MQVFFFGSSMNPPTKAHIGIVQYFADRFPEAHILVAPVYQHIFASKKPGLAEYDLRMRMAQLAFAEMPKVTVSDVEQTVSNLANRHLSATDTPLRVGTIDIIRHLKAQYPVDTEFNLILGRDTAHDLLSDKWKQGQELISNLAAVYVIGRDSSSLDLTQVNSKFAATEYLGKLRLITIEHSDPDINYASSTKAREGDASCVSPEVLQFMQDRSMYVYERPATPRPKPSV